MIGARSIGLAYASATLADEWSLFNNVGGLGKVNKLSAAYAYEARPFLQGANRMAAVINAPFSFGTSSFGFFRFGDALYSEQLISAGFSNQLGIASLGLKANYIQYSSEGFGTRTAWSINFGGLVQITPALAIGAYITNINQPEINAQNNERVPVSLTAGVSFKPASHILLLAEVQKDIAYAPTVKGAFEYIVHKKILFRTGFNVQPSAGFFGIGFISKRLKIDYGMQYSTALSLVHQASAVYHIEKRKKKDE